ncbi:GtrA family protein [Nonomuraea sp. B19D2]|uniref:GtrA family protein n=1 Tax=Nonomuraea sp. B19D2 TaxID=3159561 RepID=UPI0032DA550F
MSLRAGWSGPGPGLRHRAAYLAGGAMTAVIYYGLFACALYGFHDRVPYLAVVVVSHLVAVLIVYPWYRLVVFPGAGGSWLAGYLRFYAVGLAFLAVCAVGLPILVEVAGIPILVAQACVILMSVSVSYVLHRMWTFRSRRSSGRGKQPDNLLQRAGAVKSH